MLSMAIFNVCKTNLWFCIKHHSCRKTFLSEHVKNIHTIPFIFITFSCLQPNAHSFFIPYKHNSFQTYFTFIVPQIKENASTFNTEPIFFKQYAAAKSTEVQQWPCVCPPHPEFLKHPQTSWTTLLIWLHPNISSFCFSL